MENSDDSDKSVVECIKNRSDSLKIFEFNHSYGYNCRKNFNLCVADPDTLIFSSGNLLHFFNAKNGELSFKRGTRRGIGHITKNPKQPHIAVGEIGSKPPIIIYEWPTQNIVKTLKNGALHSFSYLTYHKDGVLLVSQSGQPDYSLIIWQWMDATIVSKVKSNIGDTLNIRFSNFFDCHFATCGSGHIKFWKMEETFTGFKLRGEIGKFGDTQVSDIIGLFFMPDGKVVSGCDWGNILVWENNFIKYEIRRKNKKSCHDDVITQFEYINSELITVGMDGWIKIWYYDIIHQEDLQADDKFVQIEPIYEFKVTSILGDNENNQLNSMLMGIEKKYCDQSDQDFWYAQDGNGSLWLIDLSIATSTATIPPTENQSKKILTCHAGAINDISTCPWSNYLASCCEGGYLNIYNYLTKKLIISHKFRVFCTKIVWLPFSMESTALTLACGFKSGTIRIIAVEISEAEIISQKNHNNIPNGSKNKEFVRIVSAMKPHKKKITAMEINYSMNLLVTGSDDFTIFCFQINSHVNNSSPLLVPIGFINVGSMVTCITWHPKNKNEVLVGCYKGYCVEVKLPDQPQSYTTISYELTQCQTTMVQFQQESELIEKSIQVETILTLNFTSDGTAWLTIDGANPEFIYKYSRENSVITNENSENNFKTKIKVTLKQIPVLSTEDNCDKSLITSCLFLNGIRNEERIGYLILGTSKGEIRTYQMEQGKDDIEDLASDSFNLEMHNYLNEIIQNISLSYDHKFLFISGSDGNIFSFKIDDELNLTVDDVDSQTGEIRSDKTMLRLLCVDEMPSNVQDMEDEEDNPTLEEIITKTEEERIQSERKKKQEMTLSTLQLLTDEYQEIFQRNAELVKSQQIPLHEFELDERITQDLDNYLKSEMDIVYKQMLFQVEKSKVRLKKLMDYFIEPITCVPFAVSKIQHPNSTVNSIIVKKLDDDFWIRYKEIKQQIEEKKKSDTRDSAGKIRVPEIEREQEIEDDGEDSDADFQKIEEIESFLRGLSSHVIEHKLGARINQMLKKYRERKARLEKRAQEWKIMNANKPDPYADDPADVEAIEEAKRSVGDYKLKINYSSGDNHLTTEENTLTKTEQLLDCKKQNYLLQEKFNEKLRNVRERKLALKEEVTTLVEKLKCIHAEMPEKYIRPLPQVLEINMVTEFPEYNIQLQDYTHTKKENTKNDEISSIDCDEEYQVLLLDEKLIESQCNKLPQFLQNCPIYKTKISVPTEEIEKINSNERVQSRWEKEMKLNRIANKVYEQECILNYIDETYKDVDKILDELEIERVQVQTSSIYSELFYLTLQQEFIILHDFEERENFLNKQVDENTEIREQLLQKIKILTNSIDRKVKQVSKFNGRIKDIKVQFSNIISGNKFSLFLKKTFKRKYQLGNMCQEISTDSSSSESNLQDDNDHDNDDDSDNSDNLTVIDSTNNSQQKIDKKSYDQLDENVCPEGCDKELYDATISMRNKRHNYEAMVKDRQRAIDNLKREMEEEQKKLKTAVNLLNISLRERQDFMREKRKKLNDIDVTVILKLHQLKLSIDNNKPEKLAKIRDCIVFDQNQLSKLYTRVGELQQAADEQKLQHEKNRNHLHKLEIDCRFMENEIKTLKEKIKNEMYNKFGREVSLIKLYEAVLQEMVCDVKADITDERKNCDKRIKKINTEYQNQIRILENLIQENTEKLSVLTVLEEEQYKLKKLTKKHPVSEEDIGKIQEEYEDDLQKLEEILQHQKQQKDLFRHEIRNLRLKSRPMTTLFRQKESTKKLFRLREQNLELNNFNDREFYCTPEKNDNDDKNDIKFQDDVFEGQAIKNGDDKSSKTLVLTTDILEKHASQNRTKKLGESKNVEYKMSECREEPTPILDWDLKLKIGELLDILGIKENEFDIHKDIIECLKTKGDSHFRIQMVMDKIFSTLSNYNSNVEVTTALKDYALQLLKEIDKIVQQKQQNEP